MWHGYNSGPLKDQGCMFYRKGFSPMFEIRFTFFPLSILLSQQSGEGNAFSRMCLLGGSPHS